MHNSEKYPAIWAEKEAAENELAALLSARAVHTAQMKQASIAIAELNAEKERLNALAMADFDRIKQLSETVARCAIAMGAVVASRGR